MQSGVVRPYALVLAFSAAILYGTTYQQFRFFDLDAHFEQSDAIHYVQMSRGNFDLEDQHRYRWLTPAAVRLVHPIVADAVQDQALATRLSFYLVNFAFSLGACLAFFALLQTLGFSVPLALLGICAFASSRITVLVTATPLVDAAYFCAIATLLYLVVAGKHLMLAVLLPALLVCKETVLLFLLLPLLTDMRKSVAYWLGLAASLLVFIASRRIIDDIYPWPAAIFADVVLEHLGAVTANLAVLLTLSGMHDLQNGFSLLLILAVAGAWLNARHRYHAIPPVVLATVPIGLAYALLSGNLGRMFFAAFPAVIAYALVSIDHVSRCRERDSDAG